ncbi:MAG TPA: SigB/SigF/SigG family RNA polymerase sigma factor [Candidatus Coproplasma excrementipullorum]|mgnify:CR=1 FL=1|nr:SigB/SigF/SigG family RNA polymerase sigma factor [Candidatus Coproplasma excrementipullorum]
MFDTETTNAYIDRAKAGDSEAKEILLKDNENLIKSIVRRYLGKGVEYDDLYQLAGMGLLKAINGFDKSYGVRFSTYAVPMIAGEIKRFMRDDGSIKVSRSLKAAAKSINAFIEEYAAMNGVQPTVKEISAKFGMPPSEVVFTMGSSRMPLSLFARSDYKDEKSQLLLDKLSSDDNQDEMIESLELRTAISELPEREKKVIMLRYFRDMTQSEVAAQLGVSQVQVSRIENKIMENFRKKLTG